MLECIREARAHGLEYEQRVRERACNLYHRDGGAWTGNDDGWEWPA